MDKCIKQLLVPTALQGSANITTAAVQALQTCLARLPAQREQLIPLILLTPDASMV